MLVTIRFPHEAHKNSFEFVQDEIKVFGSLIKRAKEGALKPKERRGLFISFVDILAYLSSLKKHMGSSLYYTRRVNEQLRKFVEILNQYPKEAKWLKAEYILYLEKKAKKRKGK